MPSPLVVKFGGSLMDAVPELARVLLSSPRPLLIVPGGGVFADLVRRTGLEGDSAHWMAVAAMEQMGWYLTHYGFQTVDTLDKPRKTAVFLPYGELRRSDPLPHSWSVTSDTIAAWVADRLGLDLLLLKSVDGIFSGGKLVEVTEAPVSTSDVDDSFIQFAIDHRITCRIINGRIPGRVRDALEGREVPGTLLLPRV